MLPRMCAKVLKSRADQLVFEQGLTESREQAKRLIMAGEVQVAVPEGSQALPVAGSYRYSSLTPFSTAQRTALK